MAKRDYFLTIDTETAVNGKVADFAAVISDKKGNVYNKCAVLVNGVFTDQQNNPLFFDPSASGDSIWSKQGAAKRYALYQDMVANGSRMIASTAAINRWLEKANVQYSPYLTAYNVAFDIDKCEKTAIDLTMFDPSRRFCLWHAAYNKWAHTKAFRQFVLDAHAFNTPTDLGNMSFKTNAEIMARFILGAPDLPDEPHTALEDIIDYELPILSRLVQTTKKKVWLNPEPFNWRNVQVKEWFKPV